MRTQPHTDISGHEGFIHGFVIARDPKTPRDTLLTLEEAARAWLVFEEHRKAEEE